MYPFDEDTTHAPNMYPFDEDTTHTTHPTTPLCIHTHTCVPCRGGWSLASTQKGASRSAEGVSAQMCSSYEADSAVSAAPSPLPASSPAPRTRSSSCPTGMPGTAQNSASGSNPVSSGGTFFDVENDGESLAHQVLADFHEELEFRSFDFGRLQCLFRLLAAIV